MGSWRRYISGQRCVTPLALRWPALPATCLSYEARNIVWKGSDPPLWRTLSSAERLAICGFPVTALDEILESIRGPVEARRNTLIGRGFHLPFTIVLFTIIALEVLGASPALRTDLSYGPAELFLRRRVHGTVFQPGAFRSFPGLITAKDLVEDIFLQLDCQNLSLASQVAKSILHTAPCTNFSFTGLILN